MNLTDSFMSFIQKVNINIDWLSFVTGIIAVLAIYSASYLANNTVLLEAKPLRVLYVGAATGHFFGQSIKDDSTKISSLYFGAFATIMVGISMFEYSADVTLTIFFSGTTLLLLHISGIIEDHDNIRELFDTISEYVPIGLIFLTISEYVVPWFISNITPFQIIGGIFVLVLIAVFTLAFSYGFVMAQEYAKKKYRDYKENPN